MNLKTVPATIALGGAGLVLMTAGAWFTAVGPAMSSIGDAGTAHAEAQDQTDSLNLQLTGLRRQVGNLPASNTQARRLDAIWPGTADQPGFFAQVSDAATDAGIAPDDVTALSPGVPEIVIRPVEVVPATDAEAAAGAASEPAAAPVDPNAAIPVTSRSVAVQEVEITVTGDYDQLAQFLENLEGMKRAVLVTGVTFASAAVTDTGTPDLSVTVTGSTFVAPPLVRPEVPES